MNVFNKLFLIGFLAVTRLQGCGEANVEDGGKVSLPTFPIAKDGFYLNEGEFNKTYSGSILVWNPKVSAKNMAKVVRASDTKLEIGIKKLKYIRDNVLPAAQDFYGKRSTVLDLAARGGQLFFRLSLEAAATWIAGKDGTGGELNTISQKLAAISSDGSGLKPDDYAQAGNYFYTYCEAKLWQRAVYYLLTQERHFRRPTPLALCEGMYLKANLLSESTPECAPAPKQNPKSYFKCLWQEGVLKTKLFQTRYGAASSFPQAGKDLAELNPTDLQNFFADKIARNDKIFLNQEQATNLDIPMNNNGSNVKAVALNWEMRPARAVDDPPTGLGNASVSEIIDSMEKPNEFASDGMRILSVSARPEAEQKLINAELKTLRNKVRTLATLSAHRYVNEVRFNGPFLAQANNEIDVHERYLKEAENNFPTVFKVASQELGAIQTEALKIKGELKDMGLAVQQKMLALEPLGCEHAKQSASLGCQDMSVTKESMQALAPENVSLALYQSSIKFEKNSANHQLWVTMYLDGRRTNEIAPIRGCINLAVKKAKIHPACDQEEGANARAEMDAVSGIITLTKTIKKPENFGLDYVPRSNLSNNGVNFSIIPVKDLVDTHMKIEFNLNNVDDVLTTLMGSLTFREKNGKKRTLYDGSIKLVDDDPIIQADMKRFATALRELAAIQ